MYCDSHCNNRKEFTFIGSIAKLKLTNLYWLFRSRFKNYAVSYKTLHHLASSLEGTKFAELDA
jgi:hypothetical protein